MTDRDLYIDRWKKIKNIKLDFKNLSRDQFINEVANINRLLRDEDSATEVLSMDVSAGTLIPPTKEVQMNILDALLSYAKKEEDPYKLAAITYYIMIDLHLFEDGNGRTSRFLYDSISGDLNESNHMYYFHRNKDAGRFSNKEDFEEFKGILSNDYFIEYANKLFENDLQPYLNQYKYLQDKQIVFRTGLSSFKELEEELVKRFNLSDLTEKEISDLARILIDGMDGVYTIAGLAIMLRAIEKGEINEWFEDNERYIVMMSELLPYDFSDTMNLLIDNKLLMSWNAEDWRKVIEYGTYYKEKQLKYMIDIFENPNKYIIDGHTMLDEVMNPNIIDQTITL